MASERKARLHNTADFLAIAAGVYALGSAIGRGPLLSTEAMEAIRFKDIAWILHIVSGALALFGMFVANRSLTLGRAMVALGGVALLATLFFFREFGALALLGVVLPALVMLGTAPLIRPPLKTDRELTAEGRPQPPQEPRAIPRH